MGKYRVLDILSYVPKQEIDLVQLETIFVNEINNVNAAANGYYVEKYKQSRELEKNSGWRFTEWRKEDWKIIAVVGYKVT